MSVGEPYDPFRPYMIGDTPYLPLPQQTQTGWVCPKCGRVHAPWVRSCDCTAQEGKFTCSTAGNTDKIDC